MMRILLMLTRFALFSLLACTVGGCARSSRDLKPVANFDVTRYTGTWYEIARLPNRFERNLEDVTAEYSRDNDSDKIIVVNRGYDVKRHKWRSIQGSARQPEPGVGLLKVTFFWPFAAVYKVLDVDREYTRVLVTSGSRRYLWILARTPNMDAQTLQSLIDRARTMGFETENVIVVAHTRSTRDESERDGHAAGPN